MDIEIELEIKVPFLIAEIGWAHLGFMETAELMIQEAAENGADICKFQTWDVSRLKSGPWDIDGRRQIYENSQLTKADHIHLDQVCNHHNVSFMSSVFSIQDAELLAEIGQQHVKIPSFESRNTELIQYCDSKFDRIFLSTGTSTLEEIKSSIGLVKNAELIVLHCVSSYPLSVHDVNYGRIGLLQKIAPLVGLSDHTPGIEATKIAAVKYPDLYCIEKHFTLSNYLPGRDNKFAIIPPQLNELSQFLELNAVINENQVQADFQDIELESRKIYSGRFNGND